MMKFAIGIVLALCLTLCSASNQAKACDAFFPGQAVAFSNGYVQQSAFFGVPSYGFVQQRAFFAPSYGIQQRAFVAQRAVVSPSIRVVNEQRGLFGRVRSRQVVQVN